MKNNSIARQKLNSILNEEAKYIWNKEGEYERKKAKIGLATGIIGAGAGLILAPKIAKKLRQNAINTAKKNIKNNAQAKRVLMKVNNPPNPELVKQEITKIKDILSTLHPDKNSSLKLLPPPKERVNEVSNTLNKIYKNRKIESQKLIERLNELKDSRNLTLDEILENEYGKNSPDARILKQILENDDEAFAKELADQLYKTDNPSSGNIYENSPQYKKKIRNLSVLGIGGLGVLGGSTAYNIANRKEKRKYTKRKLAYWQNLDNLRNERFNYNIRNLNEFTYSNTKKNTLLSLGLQVGLPLGVYALTNLKTKKQRQLEEVDNDIFERVMKQELENYKKERKERSDKGKLRGKYNVRT